jgi:arylsulfatase A-like enzyme
MIAWPEVEPGSVDALTTGVDIFATLADIFGVTPEHRTHGVSMVPLIEGSAEFVREYALSGVWGREVHLVDSSHKYARAPDGANAPLSMWSNRWSTMPIPSRPSLRLPRPDERATLDRMPGTRVPVIRQPFVAGDLLPYWALGAFSGNHLYDLENDPAEEENRAGEKREREHADRLREALLEIEAPADHLERLGLA